MRVAHIEIGFSLVEILVALFVVSLTAANISVLQKMVSDQSRDNLHHAAVIAFVSETVEEIMQYDDVQQIDNLNNTVLTHDERGTSFALNLSIATIPGTSSTELRDITITVTWPDAMEVEQRFSSHVTYYAARER